jgi:hypothetical protein
VKTLTIFVLLALSVTLISCDSDTNTTGNSTTTGTISGYVFLIDKNSNTVSDKSGVAVSLEGTSLQTLTDASGKWKITNVPAAAYTISYQKQGYGSTKIFGYQFVGNGNAYTQTMNLSQAPDSVIDFTSFNYYSADIGDDQVGIGGTSPVPIALYNTAFLICISTDSVELANDPVNSSIVARTYTGGGKVFGMGASIYDRNFPNRYAKGTKVYATLCILATGKNYFSYSTYFDYELNKEVYTAPGPASNILSTVVE